MPPLSSSPCPLPVAPPPFLRSFINPSSLSTLKSPWNCNRSGQSSDRGHDAATRLCVTRAGCYIRSSSAPRTQARLYVHTPTCVPTHTALLKLALSPSMRLSGHLLITEGTEAMSLKGLVMNHQVYLEVSYGEKRTLRVRRQL